MSTMAPAMVEEEVVRAPAPEPRFLVVAYPAQGHINPARYLARRLLRATGARVTVSTAVSALRKMFPADAPAATAGGSGADPPEPEAHRDASGVWYAPFSDGYDGGFDRDVHDATHYMYQIRAVGSATLGHVLDRLRGAGRPVTLVVYTLMLPWVADVARDRAVPAALYWIQPATVLAVYLHFYRATDGVDGAVARAAAAGDRLAEVRFPGLPPLRLRDLPSFIVSTPAENDPYAFVADAFRELVQRLDGGEDSPSVLANTFDAVEPEAAASLRDVGVDVVPVGPVLSFLDDDAAAGGGADLFSQDGKGYLEWLDAQAPGSVVYISFGSMSVMSERQIEEVARGMSESGRPFLWVLREDNRSSSDGAAAAAPLGGERGMVVAWCDQVRVLSHPAVGCFVTHCGWNSTLESMACGIPVVCAPQWTDQGTNAWLVERLGTGIRAAVSDKDGVLEADELRRCLDIATSEIVRAKAAEWRDKARAAASEGGSSESNLKAFVAKQIAAGNN